MIKTIQKFGASWCGPCKVLDKTLSQLSGIKIERFDADEDNEVFEANNIKNVPTMIFRDENGEEVIKTTGLLTLSSIKDILQEKA